MSMSKSSSGYPFNTRMSLLWPEGYMKDKAVIPLTGDTLKDLELDKFFKTFTGHDRVYMEVEPFLRGIVREPEVLKYRQDVFGDLISNPSLADCFRSLQPDLEGLKQTRFSTETSKDMDIYKVTVRLGELKSFIDVITALDKQFKSLKNELVSTGLRFLRAFIHNVMADQNFFHLTEELPGMLKAFRNVRSLTIGVNLDSSLVPCEATLLSVNSDKFEGASNNIFNKLIKSKDDSGRGIAKLHTAPLKSLRGQALDPELYGYAVNPLLVPLFKDLDEIVKKTCKPVLKALKKYVSINTVFLSDIKPELTFYLGLLDVMNSLKAAGLPLCRPVIAPASDRVCNVKDSYNINLAVHMVKQNSDPTHIADVVVKNEINQDDHGRIAILTGPNRGGKTTYTQCVGLVQALAQLGCWVPGSFARISPVDAIFTHFPSDEQVDRGTGRLGEESKRFNEIFSQCTGESLVLLNESLASTSFQESFCIARDLVKMFSLVGTRTIFATHLHELAEAACELSAPGGDTVLSLVSVVDEKAAGANINRTFKIVERPPLGHSYASQVAIKYGISYKQLEVKLSERGIIDQDRVEV